MNHILNVDEAIETLSPILKDNRLIIFVGSGISIDSQLPGWEGFLHEFIKFCEQLIENHGKNDEIQKSFNPNIFNDAKLKIQKDPIQVATVLKDKLTSYPKDSYTFDLLKNEFNVWFSRLFSNKEPNKKHNVIVETNYPYILTSNYDLLLEEAAKNIGSPYNSLSFHKPELIAETIYLKRPSIIHVHGKFTDVILNNIVFTHDDYIKIIKKGMPGFSLAMQSLFLNYSTLFVGYGASDPHLEDLLEEFSYFFNYPQNQQVSRNYLVVKKKIAGEILRNYKKKMRTELIVIESFDEYNKLLEGLKQAHPRI